MTTFSGVPLPTLTTWQWPLDLEVYDRQPRLTAGERAALSRRAQFPHRFGHWTPLFHQELGRLAKPITDALDHLEIRYDTTRAGVQRRVTQMLHEQQTAYWAWSADVWHLLLGSSRRTFAEASERSRAARGALVAVALLLRCPVPLHRLGKFERLGLAHRLFGQPRVEAALDLVMQSLVGWGYAAPSRNTLHATLCEVFLTIQSPRLEDISLDVLDRMRTDSASHKRLRSGVLRLSRALTGLRLIPQALNPWLHPGRHHASTETDHLHDADAAIAPSWLAHARRWRDTSPLSAKTRGAYYSKILISGRWATATYGDAGVPDAWTRETAADCVAMIRRRRLGEWVPARTRQRLTDPDRPLTPHTQGHFLSALSAFFRDCQEWEWLPRRFDPARAFAQPRALRALIGPNPRILADDVWAKLRWAGLNVTEADLPPAWGDRHFYPLAMVRAVTVVWLFAGLRQDEMRRLRVGCIRTAPAADGQAQPAVCLLDVPVNKTSTAFTKPVDRIVGEAVVAWEQERPTQPAAIDEKTGEPVQFLFSVRCAQFSSHYLNRSLIPALCRKAGVPPADARGPITSHRARSTIATQLFNARQPLSLFELQAWLGHATPHTTQHYARLTPTKLTRAYTDAAYFARNLRTIDVLIDQEAVRRGVPPDQPWRYYDLGHGYCTYDFFDQCPHRMACAKCSFYRPKASATVQFIEGKAGLIRLKQEIPLTEGELTAVDDGVAAFDALLTQLTDVPTPAGPTPRQLEEDAASQPTRARRP